MGFVQKVRLPLYFTRPQWPATNSVFRLADGNLKVQSAIVRKTFDAETDWLPIAWIEALRIALLHDHVSVDSTKLVGKIAMEGEAFEASWEKYTDYPTAKLEFKVQVGDYDFSNSNCVSCDQASQLDLTDDNFGVINEGDSFSGNVFTNDNIFCDPVTASIVIYSTIILAGPPTLDNSGNISFTLNTPLPDSTVYHIATYRVTCPDGSYDDADVFIGVNGSLAGCSPPANLRDTVPVTYNSHDVTWDENGSPADGWYWELYRADNLGAVLLSNTVPLGFPRAQMTGLESCTDYKLFVRSLCETGVNESEFSTYEFSTDCQEESCGRYEVGYDSGSPVRDQAEVTYLDCSSQYRTVRITNTQVRLICMLQIAEGVPADIFGGFTSIEYVSACG